MSPEEPELLGSENLFPNLCLQDSQWLESA